MKRGDWTLIAVIVLIVIGVVLWTVKAEAQHAFPADMDARGSTNPPDDTGLPWTDPDNGLTYIYDPGRDMWKHGPFSMMFSNNASPATLALKFGHGLSSDRSPVGNGDGLPGLAAADSIVFTDWTLFSDDIGGAPTCSLTVYRHFGADTATVFVQGWTSNDTTVVNQTVTSGPGFFSAYLDPCSSGPARPIIELIYYLYQR